MSRDGWRASHVERDRYIDEVVAAAPHDWLNHGVEPEPLRRMLRRCFVEDGSEWLRRPTLEELRVVSAPQPDASLSPFHSIYGNVPWSWPASFKPSRWQRGGSERLR